MGDARRFAGEKHSCQEPGSRHTEDQVAYSVPAFLECLSLLWGILGWSLAGHRLVTG